MKKIQTHEDCRFMKHCDINGLLSQDNCIYRFEIEAEKTECKHYDSPIYRAPKEGSKKAHDK